MFRPAFLLVVIALASQCRAQDISGGSTGKLADARDRLYKALFDNYNKHIIPDSASVKFGVALITAQMNEYASYLDSNIWIRMVWNDPRLRWDEDEFSKIGVLRVPVENVWIPDIRLYNAADTRHGDFDSSCDKTNVLIYPNGEVLWVPPCRFFSRCKNTLKEFPTAPQTCMMKFGSWTYDGLILDMGMYNDQKEMDMSDFDDITEWKVLSAPGDRNSKTYDCCKEPYLDVTYNVTLQRKPDTLAQPISVQA